MRINKKLSIRIVILIIAALISAAASTEFIALRHYSDSFVPSDSFSHIGYLSDYESSLKGTYADSPIYFFDSGVEGGTLFYMSGTHPNESAAILSSYLLMENLVLEKGRVIVLPISNYSASTNAYNGYGYPSYYSITTDWGVKKYKIGSRLTNPLDQWPDPPVFKQYPTGQGLCYEDARNSNRSYPGRDNGVLTERVGLAIMNLLETEDVDFAFDLHEASISYPVNNTYVVPEKSEDIAFLSMMMLEAKGINIGVELSSVTTKGYSHSNWGDIDGVYPFLIEVPTPFIERITGPLTENTVIYGTDEFLEKVSDKGYTGVEFDENGYPIEYRVGLHLSAVKEAIDIGSMMIPEAEIIAYWPGFEEISKNGIGAYLNNPENSEKLEIFVNFRNYTD